MALNPSNSSSLEQLALKGLTSAGKIANLEQTAKFCRLPDHLWLSDPGWWNFTNWTVFITPPRYGCGVLWLTCLSVRLSVCPRAYLWNRWTDPHEILCADPLWPCLDPLLVALRYIMYFGFYGWRHVWPYWARGQQGLAAVSVGDQLRARPGRSLMSMNAFLICRFIVFAASPLWTVITGWALSAVLISRQVNHYSRRVHSAYI